MHVVMMMIIIIIIYGKDKNIKRSEWHYYMHWSKYLLVFVHWVDENRASCFIAQNALENTLIEVGNPGLGYKKVKPWVWHLPQTLGPELQLGLVNPVQEIHIKQVSCEHWWLYKVQFLQQRLYFLFFFFSKLKKKTHAHTQTQQKIN